MSHLFTASNTPPVLVDAQNNCATPKKPKKNKKQRSSPSTTATAGGAACTLGTLQWVNRHRA